MSEEFVGRRKELALLEQAWEAQSGAFIPVYGRRRVGKSELLVQFMAGKPALYVTGKVAPAELRQGFSQLARLEFLVATHIDGAEEYDRGHKFNLIVLPD